MSTSVKFVCPLAVRQDPLLRPQKRPFFDDDLVMLRDGSTCLFGDQDKLFTLPIPGLDLGKPCFFISSEHVASIRKRLAHAVALEIMARVGAVPCHVDGCEHLGLECPKPNFLQRACLTNYDDSDEALALETTRQNALHKAGYSVHIHHEPVEGKKRKKK